MTLINFKLVTIICEPILNSKILELSQKFGATGFTMTEVNGQGNGEKSSGEIPDVKLKIEIVLEPGVAVQFMKSLADTYFKNYSLITYAADISVLRAEKFESEKK
jgi:nitrogen regulatory protein PII